MVTLQPQPNAAPALRILWPEVAPDRQDNLDPEDAIMAEEKAKAFRYYVKFKSVRKAAEAIATDRISGNPNAPAPKHFTTLGRYIREVVDNFRLIMLQDAAANAAMMLGKYITLETELWEEWERSKGEIVETSTTRRNTATGSNDTAQVKKKQTRANVKIAAEIRTCLDRQTELLGLLDKNAPNGMAGMPTVKLVAGISPEDLA